ncbi:MAG: RNA polymerase sigma factor [Spirochaetaceae bacterium]|jgi:RNA polymerase sigma-70 factor (ECF subfamily)|nr:RNA polymerase sigma factor [Spirochaetaceae bacterium]GMO29598.1 MAG: RNA polymerase sigma factor [Termitinemataceae bacterium]
MPLNEFKKIYDAVFPTIYRVAWRIAGSEEAAEDLCQEAFIRFYEKNIVFSSIDEAKYWLIRVVKNAALNYAKRKQYEIKVYERAFYEDFRTQNSGESDLLNKEKRRDVSAALEKLPKNLREVLALKEWGELNYKDIGRVLGISEGNVKVRVFRAREKLQSLLKADYGD